MNKFCGEPKGEVQFKGVGRRGRNVGTKFYVTKVLPVGKRCTGPEFWLDIPFKSAFE